MRLSAKRIKALQTLLNKELGLKYDDAKAQEAGLAIMRFVIAKSQREHELTKLKENEHE